MCIRQATRDREQLLLVKNDLNTAARIQQSILPQTFPPFPHRTEFDIYAQMVPAKEVGGDFYDFFFLDEDRLAFVIGDVSGKGVPAAIYMAVSRTLLKAVATQVVNPGETLRRINTMLIPEGSGRMFVTIFYGVLNTRTGDMQFSYGAQPPPYVRKSDGSVEQVKQDGGFLLGMMEGMEYDSHKVVLRPGDTVLLYTDGVTEAMTADGQLFGEERLEGALRRSNGAPIEGASAGDPDGSGELRCRGPAGRRHHHAGPAVQREVRRLRGAGSSASPHFFSPHNPPRVNPFWKRCISWVRTAPL